MKTEITSLTPDMATAFLQNNGMNRPLRTGLAERYADDMRRGRWKLNGESIVVSDEGEILDGQHRLWACVESGKPFKTVLVTGVDKAVFDTIDTGSARSAADVIGIQNRGAKSTKLLAAAARFLRGWEANRLESPSVMSRYTNTDILDTVKRNPDLQGSVDAVMNSGLRFVSSPAILAFCRHIMIGMAPEDAERFFGDLAEGAIATAGDPVLLLRDRLIRDRGTAHSLSKKMDTVRLVFHAWNARRTKRTMTKLIGKRRELTGNRNGGVSVVEGSLPKLV